MKRRIYAIATGQNQANLPSILCLGQPKRDTVVWLETPKASAEKWAEGAWRVLVKRGFTQEKLPLDDAVGLSPARMQGFLMVDIGRFPDAEPVFVLNGGLKQHALGVDRAALASERLRLAYSDIGPAEIRVLEPNAEAWVTEPIRRYLSFEDWLDLNGYAHFGKPPYNRLWPRPAELMIAPGIFARYRGDAELRRLVTRVYRELVRDADSAAAREMPSVSSWLPLKPGRAEEWEKIVRDTMGLDPATAPELVDVKGRRFERIAGFFRKIGYECQFENLDCAVTDEEVALLANDGWLMPGLHRRVLTREDLTRPAFGRFFESAVAQRVVEFLENHPESAESVAEVRLGAEVARLGVEHAAAAEYDVAILLKNAILIHLECKAYRKLNKKDDFSRLAQWQQVGKSTVVQAICAPLFTDMVENESFEAAHQIRMRVEEYRSLSPNFDFIAYTAEGQPLEYKWSGANVSVVSFEEKLAKMLKPYCRNSMEEKAATVQPAQR
ncbi:MAG TPA: hypothetical protein VKU01_23230 [Bryobacteraceae bacterium]|nr:hypothetical protein [Bryobacteraceae bacterium]